MFFLLCFLTLASGIHPEKGVALEPHTKTHTGITEQVNNTRFRAKLTGGYKNVGCYVDNQVRDLSVLASAGSNAMTIEYCAQLCSGYTYFGVQDGNQCFCGNSYGAYGVSSGGCNMACAGNSGENCGGGWANNIFQTAASIFNYIGCYGDQQARDLSFLAAGGSSTMTIENCAYLCSGYTYFGVQNGNQCFCGNSYGTYGTSTGCNTACAGNSGENCGGGWANSIYQAGYRSLGCYSDAQARDLSYLATGASSTLTVENCAQMCSGYLFFGVQDGNQCFCGNNYGNFGLSNGCNMACAGNPSQNCGGPWANSVYQQGSQTPVPSVSVTVFIGCYTDGQSRDLPIIASGGSSTMTVETCAQMCTGYKYFGVQNSDQCFCGNAYGAYGPSTGCNEQCAGNSGEKCGGGWANDVYSYVTKKWIGPHSIQGYAQTAVNGPNWNQQLTVNWGNFDLPTCSAQCTSNPSCVSAMWRTNWACVLFPVACGQDSYGQNGCAIWDTQAYYFG